MSALTDLEMTRLCAEAMCYRIIAERAANAELDYDAMILVKELTSPYWPLHNDAQAMVLLVNFRMLIELNPNILGRRVRVAGSGIQADIPPGSWDKYAINLRRAIVECVANIQKEKQK